MPTCRGDSKKTSIHFSILSFSKLTSSAFSCQNIQPFLPMMFSRPFSFKFPTIMSKVAFDVFIVHPNSITKKGQLNIVKLIQFPSVCISHRKVLPSFSSILAFSLCLPKLMKVRIKDHYFNNGE